MSELIGGSGDRTPHDTLDSPTNRVISGVTPFATRRKDCAAVTWHRPTSPDFKLDSSSVGISAFIA